MSIKDFGQKIKGFGAGQGERDLYVVLILILTALGSFGLGRWSSELSATSGKPVVLIQGATASTPLVSPTPTTSTAAASNAVTPATATSPSPSSAPSSGAGKMIVASSKGTKYYFTWCSGAKSLSEANKIYFNSEAEAQQAGLTKSTTCK